MYGPTLPATGGFMAVAGAGLIIGNVFTSWIVVLVSLAIIAAVAVSMVRLKKGEKQLSQRDN